jgi:cell division protein FtsL
LVIAEKKYSYDDNSYLNEDIQNNTKKAKRTNKKKKRTLKLMSAVFWVVFITSALIFILLRYTTITEAEYRIHSLKKEIKELENQLQDIKVTYDSLTRSDIIEEIAIKKANMQYPKYDQMVFLDIENKDDTELTVLGEDDSIDEQGLKEEKKLFTYLKASIKKLYSLLD